MIETVYSHLRTLPTHDHLTPKADLPASGIYVYFERGETVPLDGNVIPRIVRVGTHNVDGRLPKRIRQHYGSVGSFGGNKNGSVFRKHVGGAILRRANPDDPRLTEWLKQMGLSYPEVEEMVSRELRQNFTYACFRVDDPAERLTLESGLIALLAQHRIGRLSPDWLGWHADSENIRSSGLWNSRHIDGAPLTSVQLRRIAGLLQQTLAEAT